MFNVALQAATTKAASYAPAALDLKAGKFRQLLFTWDITAAERDSADETYDLYIITGDGVSEWDLVHFPQVATTGAKRFTAVVQEIMPPQTVTTAAPGVAAVVSGTLATVSGGTNAPKSLSAGMVRHGFWGNYIRYELVIAGTVASGITYSLLMSGKE